MLAVPNEVPLIIFAQKGGPNFTIPALFKYPNLKY